MAEGECLILGDLFAGRRVIDRLTRMLDVDERLCEITREGNGSRELTGHGFVLQSEAETSSKKSIEHEPTLLGGVLGVLSSKATTYLPDLFGTELNRARLVPAELVLLLVATASAHPSRTWQA